VFVWSENIVQLQSALVWEWKNIDLPDINLKVLVA